MKRIKEIVSGYFADLKELKETLDKEGFFVADMNLENVVAVYFGCGTCKIEYTIKLHWIGSTLMIYTDDITEKRIY